MIVKRTPHRVLALALVFAGIALSCANGDDISDGSASSPPTVEPVDDLPNPYNRVEPWAVLPEGMVLGAVIGAEPGPDGNVYVLHRCFENSCVDRPEDPILKLDPAGRLLASWGAGLYAFPHGFHVDPEGNVWTTDTELHQVLKFTSDGDLLMTLGQAGVAGDLPGAFNQPTDVVVGPEGNVYVTQGHSAAGAGPATHSRVARFSGDGIYVDSWGTLGSGPGELNRPHTIAIDSQDRLFVGDRSNNRIQIFDLDGRYLDAWTQFGRPSGIYITNDDTIYVADSESWGPDNPGWRKGIRVGSARDGSVAYFIEDIESTTEEHSGAEGVGVDAEGNVYGAVVRRRMLERHEPAIAP
jgi:sugar lactone lactonase YvrE